MTDSDATCPVCGTEVEATRKIGEVTHVLDPCGHEVDEEVHAELIED